VLGIMGIAVICMGCREEDQRMIDKFGDDYRSYMERVPRMNFIAGFAGLIRQNKE
jgi:protein-S-isoprenylcysteine O-methyltransferase Ste14